MSEIVDNLLVQARLLLTQINAASAITYPSLVQDNVVPYITSAAGDCQACIDALVQAQSI